MEVDPRMKPLPSPRFVNLLLCLCLLGCAWSTAAEARTVRVGVYANEPKIFADANAQPSGILGELLQAIANEERWQLQTVPCAWRCSPHCWRWPLAAACCYAARSRTRPDISRPAKRTSIPSSTASRRISTSRTRNCVISTSIARSASCSDAAPNRSSVIATPTSSTVTRRKHWASTTDAYWLASASRARKPTVIATAVTSAPTFR